MDAFCVSNAILGQMINGWLKINQFRNNLKRFSLSGLHRIDIIIYLIKIGQWQSLLLRTSTRFPTCKTTHRTPVWSIEHSRTILVISNVVWEVNHLKTSLNCRRTYVRSEYFLVLSSNFAILPELCKFDELCEKLQFEVHYAKSQHRRISEALYKENN